MNVCLFPAINNILNCPARSVRIFDLVLCVITKTALVHLVDRYDLVGSITCLVCCMCPICVEIDSAR